MAQSEVAPMLKGPVRVGELSKPRPLRRHISRQISGGDETQAAAKSESQAENASLVLEKTKQLSLSSASNLSSADSVSVTKELTGENGPVANFHSKKCTGIPDGSGAVSSKFRLAHAASKDREIFENDNYFNKQLKPNTCEPMSDSGEGSDVLCKIQEIRQTVTPPMVRHRQLSAPGGGSESVGFGGKGSWRDTERPNTEPSPFHRSSSAGHLRSQINHPPGCARSGFSSPHDRKPVTSVEDCGPVAHVKEGRSSSGSDSSWCDSTDQSQHNSRPAAPFVSSTPQSAEEEEEVELRRWSSSSVEEILGSSHAGSSHTVSSITQSSATSSFDTSIGRSQEMKFVKCSVAGADGEEEDVTFMSTDTGKLTLILALLQKDVTVRLSKMGSGTEDLMSEMGKQLGVSLTATELYDLPPGGRYSAQELVEIARHPLSRRMPFKWEDLAKRHPGICLTEIHSFFDPASYRQPSPYPALQDTLSNSWSRLPERHHGGLSPSLRECTAETSTSSVPLEYERRS